MVRKKKSSKSNSRSKKSKNVNKNLTHTKTDRCTNCYQTDPNMPTPTQELLSQRHSEQKAREQINPDARYDIPMDAPDNYNRISEEIRIEKNRRYKLWNRSNIY